MMPSALCKIVISFNKNHEYPFVSFVPTIDKAFVFTFLNPCSPSSSTCPPPHIGPGGLSYILQHNCALFCNEGIDKLDPIFSKDKISTSFRRLHIYAFLLNLFVLQHKTLGCVRLAGCVYTGMRQTVYDGVWFQSKTS